MSVCVRGSLEEMNGIKKADLIMDSERRKKGGKEERRERGKSETSYSR